METERRLKLVKLLKELSKDLLTYIAGKMPWDLLEKLEK